MTETGPPAPERHKVLRNIIVVIIGIIPIYAYLLRSSYKHAEPYTVNDTLLYPFLIGGAGIVMLLVLYRSYCGKPLKLLNRRDGTWWEDVLMGIALFGGVYFIEVLTVLMERPLETPTLEGAGYLVTIVKNPVLIAVWLGPVAWIGFAGFFELQRVFVLDLLWDVSPSIYIKWLALVLSAAVLTAGIGYYNTYTIIGVFLEAVLYGIFYLKAGRIWPMIIAHGLDKTHMIILTVLGVRELMG